MPPSSVNVFDRIVQSFQVVFRLSVPLILFPFVFLLLLNTLAVFSQPRIDQEAFQEYLKSSHISSQELGGSTENINGISGSVLLFAIGLRNNEDPDILLNNINRVVDVRGIIIWIAAVSIVGGLCGVVLNLLLIQFVAAVFHQRYLLWPDNLMTLKQYGGQYAAILWYSFMYAAIYPLAGAVILLAAVLVSYYYPGLSGSLGFAGSIVFLFSMIKGAIRQLRVFASLYIAVDEDKKPKEAVKESIRLSEGRWFRTFGNFFILGLSQWVITMIIGIIASPFASAFTRSSLSFSIFPSLATALATSISIVFTYLLFKAYRTEGTKAA